MNYGKRIAAILTALLLLCTALAACNGSTVDDGSFNPSNHLDKNGHWKNVKASKYVGSFNYQAFPIPAEIHSPDDETMQERIDELLADYTTSLQVYDRAAKDGDTVNIDYVGRVDGVAFDRGSTEGLGTEVIIGYTRYIDDFLEQIIGQRPGDTFDIYVTFPDDYGQEALNGQDAVFTTTLNYIVEEVPPVLTDSFVQETLNADYGWTTAEDAKADIREKIVLEYIDNYLMTAVAVSEVPEMMVTYQQDYIVDQYQEMAAYYGVEMDEILLYSGLTSVDDLKTTYYDDNVNEARYCLVMQFIAVDAGLKVSETELTKYLGEGYTDYEEHYGMPYLKQFALCRMVLDYIRENAVFE